MEVLPRGPIHPLGSFADVKTRTAYLDSATLHQPPGYTSTKRKRVDLA
jgi:hypothetical protein